MPKWIFEFVLLSAIWGSSFLFMRMGAQDFEPVVLAGLRVGLAALFLWPMVYLKKEWPVFMTLVRRNGHHMLVASLFNSAIPFVLFPTAVMYISTGVASIMNAMSPLFGALIAWLWLHEKLSKPQVIGLLIGFTGMVLLSSENANWASSSGWAIVLCLLATMCYGFGITYTRRYLSHVPSLSLSMGNQCGAALALVLPTLWFWPTQTPQPKAWFAVSMLAVVCTSLAYILFFRLMKMAGTQRSLTVTFIMPLFAMLYGVLFLDETITLWMLMCGSLIITGTALTTGVLEHFGRLLRVRNTE